MKKIYSLLSLFILGFLSVQAQDVSNYFFKVKTGVALEDMTNANPVLIPKGTGFEPANVGIPLDFPSGFSFKFNGMNYTQYSLSMDGAVALGPKPVTLRDFDNPIVASTGGDLYYNDNVYPIISPFGTALNYPADGSIKSNLVQTATDRKMVIEWKGNKYDGANANKIFQVWLFEKTGLVQFVYGDAYVDKYTSGVIGIGASSSDFLAVDIASGTPSSTEAPVMSGIWPGKETSYLFSPTPISEYVPISISGNPTISTNISCSGTNDGSIRLGAVTGGDGNYHYSYSGPNGFNATTQNISGLSAGVYSYTITDGTGVAPITGNVTITEAAKVTVGNIRISPQFTVSPGGNANTIYLGYGAQSVTLSSGAVTATHAVTYAWSTADGLIANSNSSSITVSPEKTTTYTLTVTDNISKCSAVKQFVVNVVDVRNGYNKVVVCHKGSSLTVNVNAVQAHLNHGDYLGTCGGTSIADYVSAFITQNSDILSDNISIYPNPTARLFNVDVKETWTKATITIYNTSGKSVAEKIVQPFGKPQTFAFDLSAQPVGIYFITLVSEQGIQVDKVVIQR